MADKMQPGRFTLRFNMNDPQQQAAVDILNRLGRQKAPFLAQALLHYAECKGATHPVSPVVVDEHTLEQAILAVLAKHPHLAQAEHFVSGAIEEQPSTQTEQTESITPVWDNLMSKESLTAINKTLAAFRNQ